MKRFHYRLDRLLRIRRLEQDERARRVSDLLDIESDRQRRVERSEERCRLAEQQIGGLRATSVPAGLQLVAESLYRGMRRKARMDRDERVKASEGVQEARDAFVEARQEARTLERLKERKRRTWRVEAGRVERRIEDEITARIAAKRERES